MLKLKINLLILLFASAFVANAQTSTYKYKRNITGVNTIWHSIKLPEQLYKNANAGFEDLRIFGTNGKDTVEVPYLLKQRADQIISTDVNFKPVNESSNPNGYYFTFQLNNPSIINEISLAFKEANFDWSATLEGSNSNTEWFTILKDYRILSIRTRIQIIDLPNSVFLIQNINIID